MFQQGPRNPGRVDELSARAGGPVADIGDTEYDMAEACAAGILALGVAGGYRPASALRQAGADFVIDDMRMLADLLRPKIDPPMETPTAATIEPPPPPGSAD